VVKPGELPPRVGGLDAEQGGEDVPIGFVGQVGVSLVGFGVLFGVEPAMFAGDPGSIGFGVGRSPRSFWISLFVFFPGGPQLRDRLSPRATVGHGLVGGANGFPVPDMLGGLLPPAGGCFRPALPFPGRTRVRPVIAVIGPVGAISGIGSWSISLARIRLVDPHLSPARDAHWQTGAFTNGKRINSAAGSLTSAPNGVS
jgi:hypothetical protein